MTDSKLAIEDEKPTYCAVCGRACKSPNSYAWHDNTVHNRKGESPWHNTAVLRELYLEKEMSTRQIAERLGCSRGTVHRCLKEHGVETRSSGEGNVLRARQECNPATYKVNSEGYTEWRERYKGTVSKVAVHRLLAVAEYGFDSVCGKLVHHGPEANIPWANWGENVQTMSWEEHSSHHNSQNSSLDKIRMAEMYRNGDCTQEVIGEVFGITQSTVSSFIREVRNGE